MKIRKNLILITVTSMLFGVLCGFYFKTLDVKIRTSTEKARAVYGVFSTLHFPKYSSYFDLNENLNEKWQHDVYLQILKKQSKFFSLARFDFNFPASIIGFIVFFTALVIIKQKISIGAVTKFFNTIEK